jgi:hypothetical protein
MTSLMMLPNAQTAKPQQPAAMRAGRKKSGPPTQAPTQTDS